VLKLGFHETFDAEFSSRGSFIHALDARLDKIGAETRHLSICAFGPFQEKPLAQCTLNEWWEWLTLANLALPGALARPFCQA
jgi:hypothetical protein